LKTEEYEKELCKAIQKHNWMRWSHIEWDALSYSRRTAYDHNLHESHIIKSEFETNRNRGVNYLLKKWMESDNATLQIAAMRIIATEEDRQRLNQQYIDHTTAGEAIRPIIKFVDGDS
jgi:hypothetical protein